MLVVDTFGNVVRNGDGNPKLIGLSYDCIDGCCPGNCELWTSAWGFGFGLLITFVFEDEGAGDERVNNCCHDFLGAVIGSGSESTCH